MGQLKDRLTSASPPWLLNTYLKIKNGLKKDIYKDVEVLSESSLGAIYHLCIQKTGSQWIKSILSDPEVFKYTGLKPYYLNADIQKSLKKLSNNNTYNDNSVDLPSKKILTPLYIYRSNFEAMAKPHRYKGFFVVRDPRDLLISQYFSKKSIHKRSKSLDPVRRELEKMSIEDGILLTLNILSQNDYWRRLSSWVYNKDENIKVVKYEDLIGESQIESFKALFEHLEIPMPEWESEDLIQKYSFQKLTGGRQQGEEVDYSHLRKGVSGDWKNYFTEAIENQFYEVTGDLVKEFGYNNY